MEEKIVAIVWLLLILLLTYWTIKIIVNVIRNERKRKTFSPNMKEGDDVYFSIATNSVNGEVLEVDGDNVKIIVTVSRSSVYPNK